LDSRTDLVKNLEARLNLPDTQAVSIKRSEPIVQQPYEELEEGASDFICTVDSGAEIAFA
jgi:hypothetical protein